MTKTTLNKTIQALKDAASPLHCADNIPHVRRVEAIRILGKNEYAHGPWLEERYNIQPTYAPAKHNHAGYGHHVWWPLDQVQACARAMFRERDYTHWTEQDARYVWLRLGHDPLPAIAKRLKRTVCSVKCVMHRRWGSYDRVFFERDKRLPIREVARICRVTTDCVRLWANRGMPCHIYPGNPRKGARYFDLAEVRAWLATKPLSLDVMHPTARQLLRLTPADLERMEREKQQESGVAA